VWRCGAHGTCTDVSSMMLPNAFFAYRQLATGNWQLTTGN
jgi:hypothetical protein